MKQRGVEGKYVQSGKDIQEGVAVCTGVWQSVHWEWQSVPGWGSLYVGSGSLYRGRAVCALEVADCVLGVVVCTGVGQSVH